MNKRRKFLLTFGFAAVAEPFASFAQLSGVRRIGFLWITSDNPSGTLGAFREGLNAQGYIEGKNIYFDDLSLVDRYDRLPEAAEKLAARNVDAIFSYGTTATIAVSRATATIPIVMLMGGDPVALGMAASLSHPGKNVTGICSINTEIVGKRLELLKEIVPSLRRVAVVFNPDSRSDVDYRQSVEAAAHRLKLEFRTAEVRTPDEIDIAIPAIAKLGVSAITFPGSTMLNAHDKRVVTAVAKTRLPAVYAAGKFTEAGGLISYAASQAENLRRAAVFIDKILKGAKPGDLPIEQPTKFELIVNLKTAKSLGVKIPQSVLVRADKVIE